MSTKEIEIRYSLLVEDTCCLSCGGAINYSQPKKGEICVDLGSGRGTDVIKLAGEVSETGFVYGIDISEGMLLKARKTAIKLGINNVKFIHSNLEQLPLKDESVDLVISNCTINHASDKQMVWSDVYRILKPGGRFVVSDIYSSELVPMEYRNDPKAVAECWAGAVTRSEYLETLKTTGFDSIVILEESSPYLKGKIEVCSITISGFKAK